MRRGEDFVEVEKTHVKIGFSGSRHTEDSVGIGLVIPTKPSSLMNNLCKLINLGVEDACILGIRDQQSRRAFRNGFL